MPSCEGCKYYQETSIGMQCHRWDFTFSRGKPKSLYDNCYTRKKKSEE